MAALGLGPQSWFVTWGWRIPFLTALVLAIVAIILRRQLEESDEFTTTRAMQVEAGGKRPTRWSRRSGTPRTRSSASSSGCRSRSRATSC
jgi:MFS family permease